MFTMNVYNNQGDCVTIREYAEDRYELDAPGCPEIMGFSGDWDAVMHETGRYGYIFSLGDNMEKSPLKAIRQHCLECCCGSAYEVKNCVIHDCNLYPFRLGNNPFRKREMTEEQKQATAERLKSARLAKKSLTNNEENSD